MSVIDIVLCAFFLIIARIEAQGSLIPLELTPKELALLQPGATVPYKFPHTDSSAAGRECGTTINEAIESTRNESSNRRRHMTSVNSTCKHCPTVVSVAFLLHYFFNFFFLPSYY